jgi:hypothetical protein
MLIVTDHPVDLGISFKLTLRIDTEFEEIISRFKIGAEE